MVTTRKKLLVLDVNGLLLDTYSKGDKRPDRPHDAKVGRFYVYKRPFCNEFIDFCLDNFAVGIWSSALGRNVNVLAEYILREATGSLAFIWSQENCTNTNFRHPDNRFKPVFLKELWRLWKKEDPNLPWEEGDYGPSNTLLIDDSSYKAINNPANTSIFPKTYTATDLEDNYLDGVLRIYLQGLVQAEDVRAYIQENPIGEPMLSARDRRWSFLFNYRKREASTCRVPAQMEGNFVPAVHALSLSKDTSMQERTAEETSLVKIVDEARTVEEPHQDLPPTLPSTAAAASSSSAAEAAVMERFGKQNYQYSDRFFVTDDQEAASLPLRTTEEAMFEEMRIILETLKFPDPTPSPEVSLHIPQPH